MRWIFGHLESSSTLSLLVNLHSRQPMLKPHTEESKWTSILSQTMSRFQMRPEISFREFSQEIQLLVQRLSRYVCIRLWPTAKYQRLYHSLFWLAHHQDSISDNSCHLVALVTNQQVHFQEGSNNQLQLEESDWTVDRDQVPRDRLPFSQIGVECTIDRALQMIVPRIRCHRSKSRGTFNRYHQFLLDQPHLKICKALGPR